MCFFSRSRALALPFALLLVSAMQGQNKTADRYAAEPFVITHSEWDYLYNANGTGYREGQMAVRIQADAATRSFGVIALQFAGASEHVEFSYARVRHANGSVTETPVTDAVEQPEQVTREAPFYSDLKEEQLPVRDLRVGDTLEWKARIVRTRAEAPNHFWGQESFLTDTQGIDLDEVVELRYPASVQATVWTNPKGPAPKESVDGNMKVVRWTTSQLVPSAGPEADAVKKAKKDKIQTPEEEQDDELGPLPSLAWTTFKSWQNVGSWYRGLEASRAVPDDEIKAKVTELTTGKTTEEDKIRAVYAYVSAQIRYIGVAFGIGRFQPHEASDVLHNQYGDCKDKATLLSAMLSALGLHPDTVLIGANIRLIEALPSPAAFNHAITHVKTGNDDVWLDATTEVGPYKYLVQPLRDKLALVVPDKGDAALIRTPKALPFVPGATWNASGEVDAKGVSNSHITFSTRGDDEVVLRSVAHQVPPSKYNDLVQELMKNIGYAGEVTHGEISRPDDTGGPFQLSFDYRRDRADDWKNLRVLPQLDPVALPPMSGNDPPPSSLQLGAPRTIESHAVMKIPEDWEVQLPDAIHAKSEWATYDITYRFDRDARSMIADRKVVILQEKVPVADWRGYKKFADSAQLGYEFYFVLQPGNGKHPSSSVTPKSSNESLMESLHVELEAAYKRKDAKELEELLKKVKSGDPKPRRYWAWEATVAGLKGKYDEAIADNRKELQLYPDEIDRWDSILYWQRRKNDKAGTEETLRAWASALPYDPTPMLNLTALLLSEDRAADALTAAQEAVKRTADGSKQKYRAEILLGRAQLKAGQTEAGKTTLATVLKDSTDPGDWNDASYELGNAWLELPLAEQKSKASVDMLTEETQSWTLDEKLSTLRSRTSLLVSSWDTLGWIFFREDKYAEAKSWLLAARQNRYNDELRQHVQQEYRALTGNSPGKENDPDAKKSDQEMRTVSLGDSAGTTGTAEYKLLLSGGKVERSLPTGIEQIDGADALLRRGDFSRFFPDGSKAKLVRVGMLNCIKDKCEIVLEP